MRTVSRISSAVMKTTVCSLLFDRRRLGLGDR
jgi:hypothetical protein